MTRPVQIVLAVLAFLGFLIGRVIYESRREWALGASEVAAGNKEGAIHHLGLAIRWYAPFNPFVVKAIHALWNIALEAEKGEPKLALLAYDDLRGSLHAVRSFYWPHKEWILKANEKIAELRAREQVQLQPDVSFEKALEYHRKVLALDERPYVGWVLLSQIGFVGWILCVIGWIWRGFDREGKMHLRPSLPWIAALVLFFSAWMAGLSRA